MKQARHRNDEALHEWRKQAKYLMNQFRILKMVFCIRFKKMRRYADELTQALGDDHDWAVLLNKLRAYHVQDANLVKSIKKRRSRLQEQAFSAGRKLYHRSAKDLVAVVAQRVLKTH